MSRPRTWTPAAGSCAAWAPTSIRTTTLLSPHACDRSSCDNPMPTGTTAVAFVGAGRTAWYHPTCATRLGIRPTS